MSGERIEEQAARYEVGDAFRDDDEVVEVHVRRPLDKVIPVRLDAQTWAAMRREAAEKGIGPSTLARMWIMERLPTAPVAGR